MIDIKDVSFTFPNESIPALTSATFIRSGGLHLITGPSGGGKSTLLRLCNGLVPQATGGRISGSVCIDGRNAFATPTRDLARTVGFLIQDSELHGVAKTVERDIAFGPENLGLSRVEISRRVDNAVSSCNLEQLRGRAMSTLSGGERQRAALAGIIAMDPQVICLDEPLAQLDTTNRESVMAICQELVRRGKTVVISEHRAHAIHAIADSIVTIEGGRLTNSAAHIEGQAMRRRPRPHGSLTWSLSDGAIGMTDRVLIDNVNLSGHRGQVMAITGANGTGKTSLLRSIAGFLPLVRGHHECIVQHCAYLPQNPATLLWRPTVKAEVEATLRARSTNVSETAINESLGAFALEHVAHRYPSDLSTGERQRAALAVVLAGAPDLVLLDEPTRGMDARACSLLIRAVDRMAAEGASIVLATHDRNLIDQLADSVWEISGNALHPVQEMHPAHKPLPAALAASS